MTAGPRWATTRAGGSACGPSRARSRTRPSALELKPGEPVLISGGARGITALVAAELARTWRPTLLIVGTTPLPGDSESADTLGLSGEAEIKAALHARLRREGRPGSPAEIETAYQALRRAREVRENLEILRQTGATVAYAEADVRDPRALARVARRLARPPWRSRRPDPRRRPDQGQAHPPQDGRIV